MVTGFSSKTQRLIFGGHPLLYILGNYGAIVPGLA